MRPLHALRPDSIPDERGRRPTLCGTHAHANRNFFPGDRRACRICAALATRYPPRWTIRPDVELAVFRATVIRRAADLGSAADELLNLAIAV
jgi:hypothetical protein